MALKYKRVLLKLSGEALAGNKGMGIDFERVLEICEVFKNVVEKTQNIEETVETVKIEEIVEEATPTPVKEKRTFANTDEIDFTCQEHWYLTKNETRLIQTWYKIKTKMEE